MELRLLPFPVEQPWAGGPPVLALSFPWGHGSASQPVCVTHDRDPTGNEPEDTL